MDRSEPTCTWEEDGEDDLRKQQGAAQFFLDDQAAINAALELDEAAATSAAAFGGTTYDAGILASMVIRERAHLNAAINATNVRRLMASMSGPLHSLLHREALEQRLGQLKGTLPGSPTRRIVSQGSQTMTRVGRTRRFD